MYNHDPPPQIPTRIRIQLIKPINPSQAPFHLLPTLNPRRPNPFRQPLREPFLVILIDRDATDDEKRPSNRDGLYPGADADGPVGLALLDDVYELRSEVAHSGAERDGRVERDLIVDEGGEPADFELVIEIAHLVWWLGVRDGEEAMDGIDADFVEDVGSGGLEVGSVFQRVGEAAHAVEASCDFAAKLRREAEAGEDWVVGDHAAAD